MVSWLIGRSTSAENLLGLGFERQNAAGTLIERFPYRDDALLLLVDNEVYSLETIRLSSPPTADPVVNENGWDGCCVDLADTGAW